MKENQLPLSTFNQEFELERTIIFDICPQKEQIAFQDPINNNLQIVNKFGQVQKKAPIESKIISLKYSPCSYYLSIITESELFIINPQKKELKLKAIDLEGLKPCLLEWSPKSVLAIGTKSGEIIFFYPQNSKKIITVGKHSNQITNLNWNQNKLLLSSSKKEKIVISNEDSQTNNCTQFQGINLQIDVSILKWIDIKNLKNKNKSSQILDKFQSDNIFAAISNDRKTFYLFDIKDNQKPLKISFNTTYGRIIDFYSLKNGDIIIGFSKGFLIKISLLNDNLLEEDDNEKIFINYFSQFIVQEQNDKIYAIGDQELKVLNIKKFKEQREFSKQFSQQNTIINISQNGQICVATNQKGLLEIMIFYLDTFPQMSDQFIIKQESCNELEIFEYNEDQNIINKINTIKEDSFEIQDYKINNDLLLIYCDNNYKLFRIGQQNQCLQSEELKDQIQLVLCNDNGFVLFSKNQLILLYGSNVQEIEILQSQTFYKDKTQIDNNFIYTVFNDQFYIYTLKDYKEVHKKQLKTNINKFFFNKKYFYCIFQCQDNQVMYYNPANQKEIILNDIQQTIKQIFFSQNNPQEFCILDTQQKLTSFITNKIHYIQNIDIQPVLESQDFQQLKERSQQICITFLQKDFMPMIYKNGYLIGLLNNQSLHKQYLSTHSFLMDQDQNEDQQQQSNDDLQSQNSFDILQDTQEQKLFQSLETKNFQIAYMILLKMKNKEKYLKEFALECLQYFEFKIAKKCFQKLKQFEIVNFIKLIQNKTSVLEQKGYIASILGQDDLAKQFFISSGNVNIAIQILQQNKNFTEALCIAKANNLKQKIAEIYIQQAQQEFTQNNFIKAISYYEQALKSSDDQKIQQKAYLGQIKICIEQKNTLKISQMLQNIQDKDYYEEIAENCYKNNIYDQGILVYKKLQNTDKIAEGLLALSKENSSQLSKLVQFIEQNLSLIQDVELLLKLGKFLEKNQHKNLAEKIYTQSRDYISLIKFFLFSKQDSQKAEEVFEKHCKKSQAAASHLAEYFNQINQDKTKSIKYYILAGKRIEAFNRARNEDLIDIYCQNVNKVDQKEALIIAQHYESKKQFCQSGKYYEQSNQLEKSLINYIKGKNYQAAIDLVMKLKSEELFEFLVQIFAGNASIYEDEQMDNIEIVEPMYLFKLYLAFDKLDNANEVSLVIIEKEAEEGNYKIARQKAFEMKNLIKQKDPSKICFELKNKFIIYHSYILAKIFIKLEKNEKAAYLLNRVCCYIDYFPKHKVQILTSAVIQCTKAKLKHLAHNWAVTLCKPNYRNQIQPKLKEKIEKIALKGAPQLESQNQIAINCNFCNASLKSCYELICHNCKNELYFCISSGTSILNNQQKGNILQCKLCNGLTYQYELQDLLSVQNQCPQCLEKHTTDLFRNVDINNTDNINVQFQFNNYK